jgi:hypothetical protein
MNMAHKDPKREAVMKLSRFLAPSVKALINEESEKPMGIEGNVLDETVEGFHFLRERTIPGVSGRMMVATLHETRAPGQLLICYLEQDAQGLWHHIGSTSVSQSPSFPDTSKKQNASPSTSFAFQTGRREPDGSTPLVPDWTGSLSHVNLSGGGWPLHFHAGGYVVGNGLDITRVRLLSTNGTVIEDTVVDTIVLFFTDQEVVFPLQAELYDQQGKLVAKHNAFGSYSLLHQQMRSDTD